MERELENLDGATLKTLYDRHMQALSNALLSGADWKDVQEERRRLITLSKLLHRRGTSHPAEEAIRNYPTAEAKTPLPPNNDLG